MRKSNEQNEMETEGKQMRGKGVKERTEGRGGKRRVGKQRRRRMSETRGNFHDRVRIRERNPSFSVEKTGIFLTMQYSHSPPK